MFLGLKAFSNILFFVLMLWAPTDQAFAHAQKPFGFFRAAPVATCAGISIGGYCWYGGTASQSCDQACATHGGCNLSGTRDYAGSNGTVGNCQAVLDAVLGGGAMGAPTSTTGYDVGCSMPSVFWRALFTSPATTCAGAVSTYIRVCACNL